MPTSSVTATARAWFQAPFKAPSACTIRITVAGGGGNHDWSVSAGASWASLDDMIADWNAALAGAVVVKLAPNVTLHRARVTITTATGANYTLTWSHSGDGTAIRNRLGSSADVTAHPSGTVAWSGVVVGAFYSWVGFGEVVRSRTGANGSAAARTFDGTIVSQHSCDGGSEPIEMDLAIRWGLPPNEIGSYRFVGHIAFEAFISDLYSAANTPSDVFAVYQLSGGATAERWLVRMGEDRPNLRPSCIVQPHQVFELTLKLDAVEAPL